MFKQKCHFNLKECKYLVYIACRGLSRCTHLQSFSWFIQHFGLPLSACNYSLTAWKVTPSPPEWNSWALGKCKYIFVLSYPVHLVILPPRKDAFASNKTKLCCLQTVFLTKLSILKQVMLIWFSTEDTHSYSDFLDDPFELTFSPSSSNGGLSPRVCPWNSSPILRCSWPMLLPAEILAASIALSVFSVQVPSKQWC